MYSKKLWVFRFKSGFRSLEATQRGPVAALYCRLRVKTTTMVQRSWRSLTMYYAAFHAFIPPCANASTVTSPRWSLALHFLYSPKPASFFDVAFLNNLHRPFL